MNLATLKLNNSRTVDAVKSLIPPAIYHAVYQKLIVKDIASKPAYKPHYSPWLEPERAAIERGLPTLTSPPGARSLEPE